MAASDWFPLNVSKDPGDWFPKLKLHKLGGSLKPGVVIADISSLALKIGSLLFFTFALDNAATGIPSFLSNASCLHIILDGTKPCFLNPPGNVFFLPFFDKELESPISSTFVVKDTNEEETEPPFVADFWALVDTVGCGDGTDDTTSIDLDFIPALSSFVLGSKSEIIRFTAAGREQFSFDVLSGERHCRFFGVPSLSSLVSKDRF